MSVRFGRPSPGGIGGKPSWNVFTGLVSPPVKTNGIWAAIDIPVNELKIIIDRVRPFAPSNNTLYISYHQSDFYPTIRPTTSLDIILQAVSVQLYTTANGWENVDAYYESNGQWRQFSQRAFFIYTATGRTLFKRDRNGIEQWRYEFTGLPAGYNIAHITCDWKNRRIFAIAVSGANNMAIRINIDGESPFVGPVLNAGPTVINRTEALFTPDGTSLIYSVGSGGNFTHYVFNINLETLLFTPLHAATNNGIVSMYMLPSGVAMGIQSSTGGNTQAVMVYPTWVAVGPNYAGGAYFNLLKTSDSEYVAFHIQAGAQSHIKGSLSAGFSGGSITNPGGRAAITCAANLINGDIVFGGNGFIDFVTVSGNTLGTIYKSFFITGTFIQIKTDPDGTLFVTTTAGIVYRIDTNDVVTQVASTNATTSSAAFNVEPANIVTNPELYPNPRSWLYNNGVGADNFEKWYSNGASAKFILGSTYMQLFSNVPGEFVLSGTVKPINLTNIRVVTITTTTGVYGAHTIGVSREKINNDYFEKSVGLSNQQVGLKTRIDVSDLTGEYYVGFYNYASSNNDSTLQILEISYE